jgi:3-deoxy-D-manno-octulosonic-acid transferase
MPPSALLPPSGKSRARLSPLNRLYRVLSSASLPLKAAEAWRHAGPRPVDMGERMGVASAPRPPGAVLAVHGNLGRGELLILKPILDWVRGQWPALNLLVVTKNLFVRDDILPMVPAGSILQCDPFNAPGPMRRFYAHWRPDFSLWLGRNPSPNVVFESARYGGGHAVLWGEIGDRALARQRRLRSLYLETFATLKFVAARSPRDAQLYTDFGAPNVMMFGDLRHCGTPLAAGPALLQDLQAVFGNRPRWVIASTRHDEHEIAARLHRRLAPRHAGLLTVVVPRLPRRGAEIADALRAQGFTVVQRSRPEPLSAATDIYVADTFGELGLWYRLCPIAVVGGTFVPVGGHNILEPARLGCAVLCGPDVRNMAGLAAEMVEAGALHKVAGEAELNAAVAALFDSPARLERARAASLDFARRSALGQENLFEKLRPYLDRAASGRQADDLDERADLTRTR